MANIEQAKELNKLLAEQAKFYAAQEQSLRNQFNFTEQLVRAMRNLDFNNASTNASELNRAIKDAANSMDEFGSGSQQNSEKIKKALLSAMSGSDDFGNSLSNLNKNFVKFAPVIGILDGVVGGFRLLHGVVNTLLTTTTSLVSAFFNIGAAIIAAPFRLLSFLMSQANNDFTELRQAIEDVRKQFGALAKNEGAAVIGAWRRIDHFGGQLAETGLSVWRTMGNMAESLKAVHEIANQLGPTFTNLRRQLELGAERIFAYQKGLGLSEEAMAGVGRRAQALGMDITEVGRQVTQMAFGMGDAFGINGKLIGRDIGEMIADFSNFGNLAVKELAKISVFAKKLGVEVKALLGVVDKFDNFEDAATSVAQLSQAFGLQLDTLELVTAQNPADRIEALRKSFFSAGRAVENMTRQERALLATQTGLDQNTLQMVFSQKNAALSYEQIQKQSKATEKQQISQAEAMQKLSSSIERLVKNMGDMEPSFFKIFIDGFSRGVKWTREWWGLMRILRHAMLTVRWAGVQVGQAFVKAFPGVKGFLTGVRSLFEADTWRKMLMGPSGVVSIFKEFFNSIAGNEPNSVKTLLTKLKENFFNWFNSSETKGKQILNGFKNFSKAFVKVGSYLFTEAVKATAAAIKGIAGFIRNPDQILGNANQASTGFAGFLLDIFRPAFKAIVDAWPILKESFMELIDAAWQKIKPAAINFIKKHWFTALSFALGPAVIGGLSRYLAVSLGMGLISGLQGGLGMFSNVAERLIGKSFGKLGRRGPLADILRGGKMASMSGKTAAGLSGPLEQLGRTKLTGASVANIVLLGTVITVGLGAIAVGLIKLAGIIQEGGLTINSIAAAGLTMTTAGVVMLEIAGTIKLLSSATQGLNPANIIKGIIAVGAVGATMAFGFIELIDVFKNVTRTQILRTLGVMTAATVTLLEIAGSILAIGVVGQVTQSFAAQVGIGLVAIGAIGAAMAFGSIKLIEAFENYSMSDINKTNIILAATSKFFLNALAVTVGSGLVGSIIALTGGLSGAAVVAGLGALSLVMINMVDSIKDIVTKVSEIKVTENTIKSLDVFTKTLDAMGKFSGNINAIIKSSTPSFMGFLMGGDNFSKNLSKVNTLIKTITTELKSSVKMVIEQAKDLAGEDNKTISAANVIANLITALGQTAKSLQPSGEFLDVGFIESLRGETVSKRIEKLGTYMSDIFNAIKGPIKSIIRDFAGLASGENIQNGLTAVSSTLSSISKMFDLANKFKGDQSNFRAASARMSEFLVSIEGFLSGAGGTTGLKQFSSRLPIWLDDIGSNAKTISKSLPNFNKVLSQIEQVTMKIDKVFNSDAMKSIGEIEDAGISKIENSVTAMVKNINNFSSAIRNVRGINLNPELQALSSRLGLKSDGKLTINQQPVTLNVNFSVKIDAEELEKVLIEREGSKIAIRGV